MLFPAYAGVIPAQGEKTDYKTPFPRLRGGDPCLGAVHAFLNVFSPPTRG